MPHDPSPPTLILDVSGCSAAASTRSGDPEPQRARVSEHGDGSPPAAAPLLPRRVRGSERVEAAPMMEAPTQRAELPLLPSATAVTG